MQNLEFKYLQIIKEIETLRGRKSKNILIRFFILLYKGMLWMRNKKLVRQFKKDGGDKEAFKIWNEMLLKYI